MKKVVVILMTVLVLSSLSGCEKAVSDETSEISGREWLAEQNETDENYMKIVESTEEIYSLYISEKMSSEDFLIELEICQKALFEYQDDYKKEKAKIIIDPQSTSVEKDGISALESLFEDMNDLYTASVDSSGKPYSVIEVSFIYLNYKEKIIDDYLKYKCAVQVLFNYNDDGTPKESEVDAGE